tara:strand:- start:2229 stop:2420 length:192 start_codon:yes stop_codon:yes gene_type:complete
MGNTCFGKKKYDDDPIEMYTQTDCMYNKVDKKYLKKRNRENLKKNNYLVNDEFTVDSDNIYGI